MASIPRLGLALSKYKKIHKMNGRRLVFISEPLDRHLDMSSSYHEFPILDTLAVINSKKSEALSQKSRTRLSYVETAILLRRLSSDLQSLLDERRREGMEQYVLDKVNQNKNPPFPAFKLIHEKGETFLTFLLKPDCLIVVYISIIELLILHFKETNRDGILIHFSKEMSKEPQANYYYGLSSGICNLKNPPPYSDSN